MDAAQQLAADQIADDELARGYRVKSVPEHINTALRGEGLPELTFIRFMRLNPARRRKVAETTQRAYHRDFKDDDILSTEQLLRLARDRGEWTDEMQSELQELKELVASAQRSLYFDGVKGSNWIVELEELIGAIDSELRAQSDESSLADIQRYMQVLTRWAYFADSELASYTSLYAKEQGTEEYIIERDYEFLMQHAPTPEIRSDLDRIQDLSAKLEKFKVFVVQREKRDELGARYARIMAESAESRRENMQAMANVYFCASQSTEDGVAGAPIAPTFDSFWDFPDVAVTWLIDEYYFFANNIPDSTRDFMETFGFIPATPAPKPGAAGESPASDASPEAPTDKSDTPAATAIRRRSSGPAARTNSTKYSSPTAATPDSTKASTDSPRLTAPATT